MDLVDDKADIIDYNTFGISVKTAGVIPFSSVDRLQEILRKIDKPYQIIGGGSNILFTKSIDQYILANDIKGIEVTHLSAEKMLLHAGSGMIWDKVVEYAVSCGLGGIENLSWIPGKVGAAPMQNIGAYGVEIKDVFHSLEALNLKTKELEVFTAEQCKFGYRESVFKNELKGKYCITKLSLKLDKKPSLNMSYGAISQTLADKGIDQPNVSDLRNVVIQIRQSKLPDPEVIGNAGSFFKNPIIALSEFNSLKERFSTVPSYPVSEDRVKVPAGWLIDQAGWKGKKVGNTGCYKNQALVIVNHGGATGIEIWNHAKNIQRSVKEKYGITLEPEVNVL